MLQWLNNIGFGSFFRALVTVALLLATLWALAKVYGVIDIPPTVNVKGEVTLDVYQRAKDILLVVLPLLTTALGYWFGAKESENAKVEKDAAVQEKDKTQRRLTAVLDSSQSPLWDAAKARDAEAFMP